MTRQQAAIKLGRNCLAKKHAYKQMRFDKTLRLRYWHHMRTHIGQRTPTVSNGKAGNAFQRLINASPVEQGQSIQRTTALPVTGTFAGCR